jgi:hypothetical protein
VADVRWKLIPVVVWMSILCFGASRSYSQVDHDLHIFAWGDTILSLADIASADCGAGVITLTDRGIDKWQRWARAEWYGDHLSPRLSGLNDSEFALELDGQVVAFGHFTSVASSHLHDGLVVYDALIRSGDRTLRVSWGCCLGRDMSEIYRERDGTMAQFWGCLRELGRLSVECSER